MKDAPDFPGPRSSSSLAAPLLACFAAFFAAILAFLLILLSGTSAAPCTACGPANATLCQYRTPAWQHDFPPFWEDTPI